MTMGASTHCIRFNLAISAEKYLAYYQGAAHNIVVRSIDNRKIQFPANAVRCFLKHHGIYGQFEIRFDENNKLIGVKQVGEG